MNSLVTYSSDSEGEQERDQDQNQASTSNLHKRTASTSNSNSNSGSDNEVDPSVDPNDLFGLNSLSSTSDSQPPNATAADSKGKAKAKGKVRGRGKKAKLDEEVPNEASESINTISTALVRSAPEIPLADPSLEASNSLLTRPTDTAMHVNIPYSEMSKPTLGPSNPFKNSKLASQNSLSGNVEGTEISEFDFRNQQQTFERLGYARNPNTFQGSNGLTGFVGNLKNVEKFGGASIAEIKSNGNSSELRKETKKLKKQRVGGADGDLEKVEGEGAYLGPWAGWKDEKIHVKDGVGPSQEELDLQEKLSTNKKKEKDEKIERNRLEESYGNEKSIFHGKSMYDYQGRTYMHIPTDVDTNLHGEVGSEPCFLPKACVHTWTGHTKGVSAIRLFPKSGHLMLSGSMDTKVKLWDVYHEGQCLRTFQGHSKAVKDITFSNDGRKFLSASYDKQIKLWDTETGQCLSSFSNGKIPYVIKFNPDEDKQNSFLVGLNDKKIIQWDINSKEITQEYDQHLGSVNSITFVDENRRFVTTSDDKTMRAWDYDIPVVIKYIADPTMHSMPAVSLHPNKKWLACQSLDNQILIFSSDSFKQNRKKVFKGHQIAGYACEISFSPDGKFISSGDGDGNLVIWDWKTCRILKRLKGHREVVISHDWLPHETSKVVTGSWDGSIKLWD